jgi:TIR domain
MADIFISYWEGEGGIATAVRHFVSQSIPGASVFKADARSIRAGDNWMNIIRRELKQSKVVLAILSNESIKRPWINFEAGAAWIDKILIPLCFGPLEKGNMPAPYNQLQALQLRDDRDSHRLIVDLYHHLKLGAPPDPLFLPLDVVLENESKYRQLRRHFHQHIVGFEME